METHESKRLNGGLVEVLPDEILHRIFSLLPIDELVFTVSHVSTRWRKLWKSHPELVFNCGTEHPRYGRIKLHNHKFGRIKLHEFVDNVLRLRNQGATSSIQTFCIHHRLPSDILPKDIRQCIATALNQGVQELDILTARQKPDGVDLAGSDIFNSTSVLTVFKFAEFGREYATQLPQSICLAANLRFINIFAIRLPNANRSGDELELCFPALERLVMTDCCHKHLKVLSISAPKLNKLSIRHDTLEDYLGSCKLVISAPVLTAFRYKGRSYTDYTFTQTCLPLLANASVTFSSMDQINKQDLLLHASKQLLKGLCNAKSLTLEGFDGIFSSVTSALTKEPPLEYQFASLRKLELNVSATASSTISKMAYLLPNSFNLLETFVWYVLSWNHSSAWYADSRSECVLPDACVLGNLKLVKILNIQGHKNENEFLKFLLKSAVVLEELIITSTRKNSWAMETVEALAHSSSRVTKKSQTLARTSSRMTTFSLNLIDFHPAN